MAKTRTPKSQRFQAPKAQGLPDRETLLRHIRETGETDRGELARTFGLKGADRRALRQMLQEMQDEGTLAKRGRKGVAQPGALPPVGVVDVVERDPDGELLVRLTKGAEDTPLVRLAPERGEAVTPRAQRERARAVACCGTRRARYPPAARWARAGSSGQAGWARRSMCSLQRAAVRCARRRRRRRSRARCCSM